MTRVGSIIGLRYLGISRGGRPSGAVVAAVIGLVLGVAMLILVMSVMNGFREELYRRLLGVIPHIEILNDELAKLPPAAGLSVPTHGRFLKFEALIGAEQPPGHVLSVLAVEPESEPSLSIIPEHIVWGKWETLAQQPDALVMGAPLAAYLDLFVGDQVRLLLLDQPAHAVVPRPRLLTFQLTGLFEVQSESDYQLAFVNVDAMLARLPPSAYQGGWRFRLEDAMAPAPQAEMLAREVSELTGHPVEVKTWADTFGELFQAVRLEKRIMFVLLLMTVLIAASGVAAAQVLAVNQKRSAIAILRTMGMSRADIMLIFLVQGLVVGCLGAFLGTVAGVALANHISDIMVWVEQYFGFQILRDTYFDQLPASWQWGDIALITGSALLLTLLSTLYPALQAGEIRPARVLN